MMKEIQLADKQMDHFTREDLEKLLAPRGGLCVSLFLPMVRRGIETKGNSIRFRNLLDEAQTRLVQAGLREPEIRDLIAQAQARIADTWFWSHQNEGLAAFLAHGEFFSYRLPLSFQELVEVTDHFVTRPLLPLLVGDGAFYLLALAKSGARLFECDRYRFTPIDLAGVTTSLPEELRYDVFEPTMQIHSGNVEGSGGRFGLHYAHGIAPDGAVIKQRVQDFCRHLDSGICELLAGARAPLVLAGVEYLSAFYRDVSHYPNVVEEGIDGNPDALRDAELQQRAWEIVEPRFTRQREAALALYRQRAGSREGRCGNSVEVVVPAAAHKRIDTLFIPNNLPVWGRYDGDRDVVAIRERRQPGDIDLLDLAAAHTLKNQGMVYNVAPESIPNHRPVAALFRY